MAGTIQGSFLTWLPQPILFDARPQDQLDFQLRLWGVPPVAGCSPTVYALLNTIATNTGGSGGGDASAANQLTEIARMDTMNAHFTTFEVFYTNIEGKQDTGNASLAHIDSIITTYTPAISGNLADISGKVTTTNARLGDPTAYGDTNGISQMLDAIRTNSQTLITNQAIGNASLNDISTSIGPVTGLNVLGYLDAINTAVYDIDSLSSSIDAHSAQIESHANNIASYTNNLNNRPVNSGLTINSISNASIAGLIAAEAAYMASNPSKSIISRTMIVDGFLAGGLIPASYNSVTVFSNI